MCEREHAEAKARIARAALTALDPREGAALLIDSGTTTGAFARLLPEHLDLTVLTNSVLIAAALAARPGCRVHIIGGQVRGLTQAAVGPEALAQLADLFTISVGIFPEKIKYSSVKLSKSLIKSLELKDILSSLVFVW